MDKKLGRECRLFDLPFRCPGLGFLCISFDYFHGLTFPHVLLFFVGLGHLLKGLVDAAHVLINAFVEPIDHLLLRLCHDHSVFILLLIKPLGIQGLHDSKQPHGQLSPNHVIGVLVLLTVIEGF